MPEARTHGARRGLPLAVDSVLLVGLLLTGLGGSSSPATGDPLENAVASHPSESAPGAGLTVDPPSFWMRTGENLSLQAVWSTDSPLCPVAPLWFRWSVEGGVATGFLNTTSGPSVTFTADSFDSGNVTVVVRSAAELDCGSYGTVVERSNSTEISMVAPLSLTGVEVGPNPLPPGGVATLVGTVTGGDPPYTVDVVWGDGTRSRITPRAPGTFSVNHTFLSGDFVPYVLVGDSEGDLENRSVSEALSVGSGFQAAIVPASFIAEVGVPVEFVGVATDPPSGSVVILDCTNATVDNSSASSPSTPNSTSFVCTFHTPGTAEVLFGEYPPYPGGPEASALLYETVVPPPGLEVTPVETVGEAGSTAAVQVALSGGAPPFSLTWNLTGNRSGGSEAVDSDGGGVVTLSLATAGEYSLGIRATDSFGGVGANETARLQVDPALEAGASAARSPESYGILAQVAGEVLSGCPPFSWWVVPDLAPESGSVGNGSLGTVGGFSWSGGFAREGNLSLVVGVADGCGISWQTGLTVALVPPLVAELSAGVGPSSPNETLVVNLSIQGGWPPFRLFVNASDNESWNWTTPSAGAFRVGFGTHANGSLVLVASVSDSLGASVESTLTVVFPTRDPIPWSPPPSETSGPPTGTSSPSSLDVVGLLASFAVPASLGTGVAIVWRRRSRKSARKVAGPDPVAVLKQIIEPAEGAERFTVELLAEEAGIPLAVVRSTIDRLVSQGTVLSESGADGEEVLSWSDTGGR